MLKLKILPWLSCVLLVACSHQKEKTPEPELHLLFSKLSCYDNDTILISAYLDGAPWHGNIRWNRNDIYQGQNGHEWIVPALLSDSTTIVVTGWYGSQTVSQLIRVTKRAHAYPSVSYEHIIQPLFNSNCNFSGCHGNGSRAGKIELSCYDSTLKYVAPYNAAASLLYIALVKTDPLRVMPPAGKLHDYKIQDVKTWIGQGAKNN